MKSLNNRYVIGLLLVGFLIFVLIENGEGDNPLKVADPLIRHDPPAGDFPK